MRTWGSRSVTWAHTCSQDVLQASHSHLWILQTLSSKVTSCAVQLLYCTDISSVCTANATLYKGIKIQMNYFTHPHLVVNLYVTLSSVDHNRRYLVVLSSYNGSEWGSVLFDNQPSSKNLLLCTEEERRWNNYSFKSHQNVMYPIKRTQ